MESEHAYFRRRAAQEQSAAISASLPTARHAHLDLARRYSDQADQILANENDSAEDEDTVEAQAATAR